MISFTRRWIVAALVAGCLVTLFQVITLDSVTDQDTETRVPPADDSREALLRRLELLEERLAAFESRNAIAGHTTGPDRSADPILKLGSRIDDLSFRQKLITASIDSLLLKGSTQSQDGDSMTGYNDSGADPRTRAGEDESYDPHAAPATDPVEQLDAQFWAQEFDESWTQATASDVRRNLVNGELDGSSLIEAQCHASICRLAIAHSDENARDLFLLDFGRVVSFDANASSRPLATGDSGIGTLMYLARRP